MQTSSPTPYTKQTSSGNIEHQSKRKRFIAKMRAMKSAVKRFAHKTKSIRPIRLREKSTYVPFHVWEAQYLEKQRSMAESERKDAADVTPIDHGRDSGGSACEADMDTSEDTAQVSVAVDNIAPKTGEIAGWECDKLKMQQPSDVSIVKIIASVCPQSDKQRNGELEMSLAKKLDEAVESQTRNTDDSNNQNSNQSSLSNQETDAHLQGTRQAMEAQQIQGCAKEIAQTCDNEPSSPTYESTNFTDEVPIVAAGGLTTGKKLVHDEADCEARIWLPLRESTAVLKPSSLRITIISSAEVSPMDSGAHGDTSPVCERAVSAGGTTTNCEPDEIWSARSVDDSDTSVDGATPNTDDISTSVKDNPDTANESEEEQGRSVAQYKSTTLCLTRWSLVKGCNHHNHNLQTDRTEASRFGVALTSIFRKVRAGVFSRRLAMDGNGGRNQAVGLGAISDASWSHNQDKEVVVRSRRNRRGYIFGLLAITFFLRR